MNGGPRVRASRGPSLRERRSHTKVWIEGLNSTIDLNRRQRKRTRENLSVLLCFLCCLLFSLSRLEFASP